MNPIDKEKCADLLREMCANMKKKPHYSDVRQQVNELIKFADKLWPPDKNPIAKMQWDAIQAALGGHITPDELEAGLEEMKERNQSATLPADKKSEKVEIAY